MSPSWALKGPISFISGGDAPKVEQESIEVEIVHHINTHSRKLCSKYIGNVDNWRSFLALHFRKYRKDDKM